MDHYTEEEIQAAKEAKKIVLESKDKHLMGVYMAGEICQWVEWQDFIKRLKDLVEENSYQDGEEIFTHSVIDSDVILMFLKEEIEDEQEKTTSDN